MALRLDPQNRRLHSRKQVRQIANSIKSFGFNVPVLIDAEKSVIAGHGRVLAAKELGWTEVPVIAIEHLDAAQRRAFAIADNRLTENSTWDDRLLAELLKELSVLDLSFDLEATGFEMGEIDFRIESLGEKPETPDPADQLPSLQERAASRVGDLWQLGRHRALCGNASTGAASPSSWKARSQISSLPTRPLTSRLRAMSAGLVRFVIVSSPWPQGR